MVEPAVARCRQRSDGRAAEAGNAASVRRSRLAMSDLGSQTFGVTLERGRDGSYGAWVDDLPGCAVRGQTREQVLERLPQAIAGFLAWSGDNVPAHVEVAVTAEVKTAIEADEDTEVLVEADRQPLSEDDWRAIARSLDRSRQELEALLARLDEEQLARRRPGSERTVREEIEHIAFVEFMYAVWTFDLGSKDGLGDFLGWTRRLAADRLGELARARDAQETFAHWGGAPRPEPWTARKAARRLLWHELLHLRAIEGDLRADSPSASDGESA
jgi:predicted RNase H-like HicB family nuclease